MRPRNKGLRRQIATLTMIRKPSLQRRGLSSAEHRERKREREIDGEEFHFFATSQSGFLLSVRHDRTANRLRVPGIIRGAMLDLNNASRS